jgi:hypothetical protein
VTQFYPATDSMHTADSTVETWYAPGDTSLSSPLRTITTVHDAAGETVSINDVAGALLTTLSLWSGTYDNLGRITGSTQSFFLGDPTIIPPGSGAGTVSPTQTFVYGYTNNGLLNALTLTAGSNTDSLAYGFDNLYKMKGDILLNFKVECPFYFPYPLFPQITGTASDGLQEVVVVLPILTDTRRAPPGRDRSPTCRQHHSQNHGHEIFSTSAIQSRREKFAPVCYSLGQRPCNRRGTPFGQNSSW